MNDSVFGFPTIKFLLSVFELELVDGTGSSSSTGDSDSLSLGVECSQLTSHEGCGNRPVTESVTRLNID